MNNHLTIKQAARCKEDVMERFYEDCRDYPSDKKCTVAISADSKDELMEASVQHAVYVHGHTDTPEFREEILKTFKEGAPAV